LIECINSAEKLLEFPLDYDVVFLDIEMPYMNGIDVAKKIDNQICKIVFVTNREDFVFTAVNSVNSFGFIRKSHLENDLVKVFDRILKDDRNSKYLLLKHNYEIVKVKYSDILYVEKIKNNIHFHTINNVYSVKDTLTNYEEILKSFGVVRCLAGYIVNLNYVNKIGRKDIVLTNNFIVPMSRNKQNIVKEEFMKMDVII
jgi:DNA-binding LytR/AlgR family response regulator